MNPRLRDRLLITGAGGGGGVLLQNEGGGQVGFYPFRKGGGKSFSRAEGWVWGGGGTTSFVVALMQELEVIA